MKIEDLLEKTKQSGGILAIERKIGAEDSLARVENALSGYKIFRASPGGVATVFKKAIPQYAELFRIKVSPKVLSAYFISKNGMLIAKHDARL